MLAAGTQLMTIGQLDALEIESDVLSQDVVRVKEGDPVEVYGPAVGGGLGEVSPVRSTRFIRPDSPKSVPWESSNNVSKSLSGLPRTWSNSCAIGAWELTIASACGSSRDNNPVHYSSPVPRCFVGPTGLAAVCGDAQGEPA